VGIYFGRQQRQTPTGTEQWFASIAFADQGSNTGHRTLNLHVYAEQESNQACYNFQKLLGGDTPAIALPLVAKPTPFRHLDVIVDPVGLTASWNDGLRPLEVPIEKVKQGMAHVAFLRDPEKPPVVEFHHGGGLGLFVERGIAIFQRVEVIPLPSE
jgi:hypothetical protein